MADLHCEARDPNLGPASVVRYTDGSGMDGGDVRSARPNVRHAQPLKIMSMATNVPITHSTDDGHSLQISRPRPTLTAPLRAAQPQLGKRISTAATAWNRPPPM